jgi:Raf kinase inhibitor-like YbhB/YbcL family protein
MVILESFSMRRLVPAAAAALALAGTTLSASGATNRVTVSSPAFKEGGTIPKRAVYVGCVAGATNRSPALEWHGAPRATKSFALILFDPDAPTGHGFYHWLLFDIPPSVTALADGAGDPSSSAAVPGAVYGRSDFGSSKYGGPCPPRGDKPHHYLFTISALDVAKVKGVTGATMGPELEAALRGHVIAHGTLTGRFGR